MAVTLSPAAADRYDTAETAHLLGQYDKSRRLLLPLAKKGDKRAQYLLGRQYQMGQGVAKDPVQAYVWYSRAAKQGHAEAGLFKHLLVSKWKMTSDQVARAEAILADKEPGAVTSTKPTKPIATKPPTPTANRTGDFGPLEPDPRRPGNDDRGRNDTARDNEGWENENTPPAKSSPDKPSPRATAKAPPKKVEPSDEEIMRREREADRKAEEAARRRREAAERREIEARRRAEALRREMENNRRAPYIPEDDDDPPVAERWAPPLIAPYAYRWFYWQYYWRYHVPPARVYAPRVYGPPPPRWRHRYHRYRHYRRWQRQRAWRREYRHRHRHRHRRY